MQGGLGEDDPGAPEASWQYLQVDRWLGTTGRHFIVTGALWTGFGVSLGFTEIEREKNEMFAVIVICELSMYSKPA